LTREECARSYHIPPPLVGILDHATFSNITEQHKSLYTDTLGPWLEMIQQDIELQLLPEFDDVDGVYLEFNIAEKLKGDFKEQTSALQSAVGRPWLTADEARGLMNLPSLGGDAAELVTPLNVIVGGQASPNDSAPPPDSVTPPKQLPAPDGKRRGLGSYAPQLRARHQQQWTAALSHHYQRQAATIISHVPKGRKADLGGVWWDTDRWNAELYTDLFKLNILTAGQWAQRLAFQLDIEVSEEIMLPWLEEHSRIQAEAINTRTQAAVMEALRAEDPPGAVRQVFDVAGTAWATEQAVSAVLAASNFGSGEAARVGGLRMKTWRTNSASPRSAHALMDGETVSMDENFSNGMRWPGDPTGGAENNANCQCSVDFG
jgi:hypothetical protein